ncbi:MULTISPECIES: hypothetical protein [Paenibacillus]
MNQKLTMTSRSLERQDGATMDKLTFALLKGIDADLSKITVIYGRETK